MVLLQKQMDQSRPEYGRHEPIQFVMPIALSARPLNLLILFTLIIFSCSLRNEGRKSETSRKGNEGT